MNLNLKSFANNLLHSSQAICKKGKKHDNPLRIEVHIAEHCNLNCIGCTHFSPLAKPEYADIVKFTESLSRLKTIVQDSEFKKYRDRIILRLMGGEPLLNPDIDKFMTVARNLFQEDEILLVTNGLLLPSMNENFWKSCANNNITISPTKYPINFDYDQAERLALENNVGYRYYGDADVIKTMHKLPLDPKGQRNAAKEYKECCEKYCNNLRNGRLYMCPFAANVHHLNEFFGTNFVESQEDFIDLYKTNSVQELIEFLEHPIPFCRYCAFEDMEYNIPWSRSQNERSEWLLEK